MAIAVNYSTARPSIASLKAAKVQAVIRYLNGGSKAITPIELAGLLFGGLEVAFAFEIGTNDIAGGESAGAQHAEAVVSAFGPWVCLGRHRPTTRSTKTCRTPRARSPTSRASTRWCR